MQSTSRIKRLPLHEAHKIAAGEVIERPTSIVKELIENSIDAGATTIDLHMQNAGLDKIRIIDNGSGMSLEDARICTEQYATSKISSIDELQSLHTFGFRGEALASIATVSKFTLITKDQAMSQGVRITMYNNEQHEECVAAAQGTEICVQDLFYNVPARRKFLKTVETEWRHTLTLLHAFCLSHPEIHFTVTHNGTTVLSCPPTTCIARIAQLWNADTAQRMLACTYAHQEKNFTLQAILSDYQVNRFDRSSIFFFVNRRWIKNQNLSKALLKGYMNVLPPGRYPIVALFIDIDAAQLDINIHPRKEEVLFLHAHALETSIAKIVRETLEKCLSQRLQSSQTSYHPIAPLPQPFAAEPIQAAWPRALDTAVSAAVSHSIHTPFASSPITAPITFALEQQTCIQPQDLINDQIFDIIGCYKNTYILIQKDDGLLIVDQHAAHERILYEKFDSYFDELLPNALALPITITVTQAELELLMQHTDLLAKNGIIVETFGVNQLLITATPVCLKNIAYHELLPMIVQWIMEEQHISREELHAIIAKKVHSMMACKAAVKAGDVLTQEQMHELLKNLQTTPKRFSSPHGRPTCWLINHTEIEKKFKRRL
jgi:DNA mismatch repair protein MutL